MAQNSVNLTPILDLSYKASSEESFNELQITDSGAGES
jgi:hypothetical protein